MYFKRFLILILSSFFILFSQSSFACTIVSCAMHGEVFAAANEDDYTPFTRIWFNPTTKERFGWVAFGAPDLQIAAAMNEYGLFFDYTAQNGIDESKYQLKNPYRGDLFPEIIGRCRTVSEALEFLENHEYTAASQVLLADATGASVILHVGVKVKKNGAFQVNTNFDILNLPGKKYSCKRFDIATQMLNETKQVDVLLLRDLLNETHQEGALSTQYSNIYDLKRGKIYVYLFHNYNHVYEIDLKKELSKGYRLEMLADHFPLSFAYDSYTRKHLLYRKELIMKECKSNGTTATIDKYISALPDADSATRFSLIDVSVQLIKDANNQQTQGRVWDYWFSYPSAFTVVPYADKRLEDASRLTKALAQQSWTDLRYKNFLLELTAYLHLAQNEISAGKELYNKLSADSSGTFAVTLNRSREMLKRINQ